MKISVIAAMDREHVIGFRGCIPWYVPEDLLHFHKTVKNHVLICGRKTYETLPKRYRNKYTIVLSRRPSSGKCTVASSMIDAIRKGKKLAEDTNKPSNLFIIGGGQVYEESVLLADELILSYIRGCYKGDTYFPNFTYSKWKADAVKDYKDFKVIWWRKR